MVWAVTHLQPSHFLWSLWEAVDSHQTLSDRISAEMPGQGLKMYCISIGDGLLDTQWLSNKPLNLISVSLNYNFVESIRSQKNCNWDISHVVIGSRPWSWEIVWKGWTWKLRNACEKVGIKRQWRVCLRFIYKTILSYLLT